MKAICLLFITTFLLFAISLVPSCLADTEVYNPLNDLANCSPTNQTVAYYFNTTQWKCARAKFLLYIQNLGNPPLSLNISDYWSSATRCPTCVGDLGPLTTLVASPGISNDTATDLIAILNSLMGLRPNKCIRSPDFCSGSYPDPNYASYSPCTRQYCYYHPGVPCRLFDDNYNLINGNLSTCFTADTFQANHITCSELGCVKLNKRSFCSYISCSNCGAYSSPCCWTSWTGSMVCTCPGTTGTNDSNSI